MRLEHMAEVRKARGLNQRDLGARVSMDQSYVSKVERGMSVPTRVAEDIARAPQPRVASLDRTITFDLADPDDDPTEIRVWEPVKEKATNPVSAYKTIQEIRND